MIVMNTSKNETDGRSLYRIIHDGDRDIKFDLLTASGLTLAEIPPFSFDCLPTDYFQLIHQIHT